MTAPPTPPEPVTVRVFTQLFSASPRGARLARHVALARLHAWGVARGTAASDTAAVIVAELASNAVFHGRVPGRSFELRLVLVRGTVRIEVSDARGERRPPVQGRLSQPSAYADSGRGLLLVDELADRWAVLDRVPIGKTVRAEVDLPPRLRSAASGPR